MQFLINRIILLKSTFLTTNIQRITILMNTKFVLALIIYIFGVAIIKTKD